MILSMKTTVSREDGLSLLTGGTLTWLWCQNRLSLKVMQVCKCMIMRFPLSCKSVTFRNVSELRYNNSCWPVMTTLSTKTKHPVSASIPAPNCFHFIWVILLQFKKYNLKLFAELIKCDRCVSSRAILREVKGDGRKGWRDQRERWYQLSDWDAEQRGQVEKLGDVSLIGTLIAPGQIQHSGVRFKMYWQMFPRAWEGKDVFH